ncbi:hypothetical protein [Pseudomonas cavernae]|nr:hypothetical protein [Pseudomonas cavernae]
MSRLPCYRYRCEGSTRYSTGHAYNMAGLGSNCYADTIDIAPSCPPEQVVAEATAFVVCQ